MTAVFSPFFFQRSKSKALVHTCATRAAHVHNVVTILGAVPCGDFPPCDWWLLNLCENWGHSVGHRSSFHVSLVAIESTEVKGLGDIGSLLIRLAAIGRNTQTVVSLHSGLSILSEGVDLLFREKKFFIFFCGYRGKVV